MLTSVNQLIIRLLCCCFQVRVVGPQYQENRVVQRRRGEAASFGQADADSVEDYCSYHRTHCCPVSGALRIPAVWFYTLHMFNNNFLISCRIIYCKVSEAPLFKTIHFLLWTFTICVFMDVCVKRQSSTER